MARDSRNKFTGVSLLVRNNNVAELNRALAQIRDELDQLQGLRGEISVYGTLLIKDDQGRTVHSFGGGGS